MVMTTAEVMARRCWEEPWKCLDLACKHSLVCQLNLKPREAKPVLGQAESLTTGKPIKRQLVKPEPERRPFTPPKTPSGLD